MSQMLIRQRIVFKLSLAMALLGGCADEAPRPAAMRTSGTSVADAGSEAGDDASVTVRALACVPARSSEPIPARTVATSSEARSGDKLIYLSELYGLFNSNCGQCHGGDAHSGNFNLKLDTFRDGADQKIIDRILSTDPDKMMPPKPSGILASMRQPGDSVLQLAAWTQLYLDQKSPADAFTQPADQSDAGAAVSPYLLSVASGANLTNIGSCIPAPVIVGVATDKMAELDDMFANLDKSPPGQGSLAERIGLPAQLDQTDLFTLDTEELARHGVIAYAPGYPLWSDGARKLRLVRVPKGQSIHFNADTQAFDIPDNTRFYKTFLKQVLQLDGTVRWRKVETRLIVARHNGADGTPRSLFGTYKWDDDERVATLETRTQRDLEPFGDDLITVVVDEIKQQEVLATHPKKPSEPLLAAQAIRHYAIPSKDRCMQCHQGSPTNDFVLGFLPLQIKRLAAGQEGVIEESGPDELGQLQRLIDYGVVTGLDSPDAVTPLSASEATPEGKPRPPRNRYELEAQGYMLGNCAHCHNPHGYTTVNNPSLAGKLDFLPSRSGGGIFQFDLQTTSPRILHGATPIPYITPSLYEISTAAVAKGLSGSFSSDPTLELMLAPWRSLIWRNVDTPFTYTTGYSDGPVIYPHMPMNVPGYDCRAPRILGDWMVSIPSHLKPAAPGESNVREEQVCAAADNGPCRPGTNLDEPQPYAEVFPGDPGYQPALAEAEARLRKYHSRVTLAWSPSGIPVRTTWPVRYSYCPDTSDIVDPSVTDMQDARVPASSGVVLNPDGTVRMVDDGVPDHPHWVATDITERPPPWAPRRDDFPSVLGLPHHPGLHPPDNQPDAVKQWQLSKRAAELLVPEGSPPLTVSDELARFAKEKLVVGVWDESKSKCPPDTTVSTVASLDVLNTPRWLRKASTYYDVTRDGPPPKPGDHVYKELPGQAVYGMICVNCHGDKFDSRGRLADSLMNMTGGLARVANFRDGLFGMAGAIRQTALGGTVETMMPKGTVDDWSARYLAWMGLGGTNAGIPQSLINLVSSTKFVGRGRSGPVSTSSANMLEVARQLCADVLPGDAAPGTSVTISLEGDGWFADKDRQTTYRQKLIRQNGDAELWIKLCSINNPAPVRAIDINGEKATVAGVLYPASAYPASSPVGDIDGALQASLSGTNLFAWCVKDSPDARAYAQNHRPLAWCPSGLPTMSSDESNDWATRGAINAAFAVFVFLDSVSKGTTTPVPDYTRCDLTAPSTP